MFRELILDSEGSGSGAPRAEDGSSKGPKTKRPRIPQVFPKFVSQQLITTEVVDLKSVHV